MEMISADAAMAASLTRAPTSSTIGSQLPRRATKNVTFDVLREN
jgi:hypothetical protein